MKKNSPVGPMDPPYQDLWQHLLDNPTQVPLESGEMCEGSPRERGNTVVIGSIVEVSDKFVPRVDFPGNPSTGSVVARTVVELDKKECGSEVALMFENGDLDRPIILGTLVSPSTGTRNSAPCCGAEVECQIDDERLVLKAEREIVLQCGKASITLTKTGKILIRGAYVSSRSSGVNRIKGASVQIN